MAISVPIDPLEEIGGVSISSNKDEPEREADTSAVPLDPLTTALRGLFGPVLQITRDLPPLLAYGIVIVVLIVVLALLQVAIEGWLAWLLGVVVTLVVAAYVFTEWNTRRHSTAAPKEPYRSEAEVTLGPFGREQFSDDRVNDVISRLRKLHQDLDTEFLPRVKLRNELDHLFGRKTFRYERLRECPDQRWGDRLDSAYQTEKVLRDYERNVRQVAPDKYQLYQNLIREIGHYCMEMGEPLFEAPVDYNIVREHIGKPLFKDNLPPEVRFPAEPDRSPIIPDETNNPVEEPRVRAVELMDQLIQQ
jgi:hypothetical protein